MNQEIDDFYFSVIQANRNQANAFLTDMGKFMTVAHFAHVVQTRPNEQNRPNDQNIQVIPENQQDQSQQNNQNLAGSQREDKSEDQSDSQSWHEGKDEIIQVAEDGEGKKDYIQDQKVPEVQEVEFDVYPGANITVRNRIPIKKQKWCIPQQYKRILRKDNYQDIQLAKHDSASADYISPTRLYFATSKGNISQKELADFIADGRGQLYVQGYVKRQGRQSYQRLGGKVQLFTFPETQEIYSKTTFYFFYYKMQNDNIQLIKGHSGSALYLRYSNPNKIPLALGIHIGMLEKIQDKIYCARKIYKDLFVGGQQPHKKWKASQYFSVGEQQIKDVYVSSLTTKGYIKNQKMIKFHTFSKIKDQKLKIWFNKNKKTKLIKQTKIVVKRHNKVEKKDVQIFQFIYDFQKKIGTITEFSIQSNEKSKISIKGQLQGQIFYVKTKIMEKQKSLIFMDQMEYSVQLDLQEVSQNDKISFQILDTQSMTNNKGSSKIRQYMTNNKGSGQISQQGSQKQKVIMQQIKQYQQTPQQS